MAADLPAHHPMQNVQPRCGQSISKVTNVDLSSSVLAASHAVVCIEDLHLSAAPCSRLAFGPLHACRGPAGPSDRTCYKLAGICVLVSGYPPSVEPIADENVFAPREGFSTHSNLKARTQPALMFRTVDRCPPGSHLSALPSGMLSEHNVPLPPSHFAGSTESRGDGLLLPTRFS